MESDVSFAAKAAMNPAKVTPLVTIACATSICSVRHEVIGKCVAVSPACSTIVDAVVSLTSYQVKTFTHADFVAAGAKLTTDCPVTQRLDIMAVKIVDENGGSIRVSVQYRTTDAAKYNPLKAKNVWDTTCYTSSGTKTSFATRADTNPLHRDAIVEVQCMSMGTTSCSIKYDIAAQCIPKSTTCVTAPSGGATFVHTKKIDVTEFKDATAPTNTLPGSGIGKRAVIIKSLRVVETNGASVNVSVVYQKGDTHKSEVKALSDLSCYESVVDELRCNAGFNPFMLTLYVTIMCLARGNPCVLKYEVLSEYVVASTKCASLASSTTTITDAQPITTDSVLQTALAKFVGTDAAKNRSPAMAPPNVRTFSRPRS